MNKYERRLKQDTESKKSPIRYQKADLELMTTFQLKEICTRDRIIQGVINPMDKEELIPAILQFRGVDKYFLIQKQNEIGRKAIEDAIKRSKLQVLPSGFLHCRSKITVYQGLAIGYHDEYTIPYDKCLVGSNAFLVSGNGTLCAILNLLPKGRKTDVLYLTKAAEITCIEMEVKNYNLYCMECKETEFLYRIHEGKEESVLEYLPLYRVSLLDFEIKKPVKLSVPVEIDFGTTNTTAGIFLDYHYFEQTGRSVANQYKCLIENVHISCPVKQKRQFLQLFDEILPGYAVRDEDMIDEGVAVLYNAISDMITQKRFKDGKEYKALIMVGII